MSRIDRQIRGLWIMVLVVAAIVAGVFGLSVLAGVSGDIDLTPKLIHEGTPGVTTPTEQVRAWTSWTVTDSTNAAGMTELYVAASTMAGGAGDLYDLYGSLTDSFGDTVNMTKLKMLVVLANATNYGSIAVGGAPSNALTNWINSTTAQIELDPGHSLVILGPTLGGYAITNTVSDTLMVTNMHASSNGTYKIFVGGGAD